MKAVEFETELDDKAILIPKDFQLELSLSKDKHVRVIVLYNDLEEGAGKSFGRLTTEQFLKGYDESDSVYDNV